MSSDDGYVHDPERFREGEGASDDREPPDEDRSATADATAASEEELGVGGWVLVAVLVVCLFVIPAIVIARPPALPWEVSLLALPMLPGIVLGALAVWTAVRDRQA